MNISTLYSDLNNFYSTNFSTLKIINPRYILNGNCLSWANHQNTPYFETYGDYFFWVINQNQYSLMLEDESVVQLYYEGLYDKKKRNYIVIKGSLAYLPKPDRYSIYFRFDMDSTSPITLKHSIYHIHFGYKSNQTRFSLYHFPKPSVFLNFVLFIEYGHSCDLFKKGYFLNNLDELRHEYNHAFSFKTCRK